MTTESVAHQPWKSLLGALLAIPWLSAYAPGPTPNTLPWLISAACAIVLSQFWRKLDVEVIRSVWVLVATFGAVMGIFQYFGGTEALSPWVSKTNPGEAYANLRQRNQFATLTSIGLLALIGWLARKLPGDRVLRRASFVALLLVIGNAASGSRTGLLQWVLIVALTAWWELTVHHDRRRLSVFAVYVMLAYLVVAATLPWLLIATTGYTSGGLMGRFAEASTCAGRGVLWSNVLTLIAQKPWFGWGWGELDYAHYLTLYPGARFCDILDNAHNLPLHLAVELGLPVAAIVCGGFCWAIWRTKPWRETDPARQMAWGVLAVIMLHSLLEYPLWYGPFQMAVGLCVWILWVTPRERVAGSPECSLVVPVVRLVLASALFAAATYAAWDYHRVSQIYLAPQARNAAYREDTMEKIRGSWLFRNQVRFAELTTTPLKRDNAQWTFDTATGLLHFSPEPRVIEKVIESAVMLGRDDDALLHLVRYRAAFPEDHEKWRHANRLGEVPAD